MGDNVGQFEYGSRNPDAQVPDLLTEEELIRFLRIREVSTATDYHNVVQNLIRFRDLPRIHISKKLLFPKRAILKWLEHETIPRKFLDAA